ncbi:MAG TPA: sulfatase [Anaerolineales bacterium]
MMRTRDILPLLASFLLFGACGCSTLKLFPAPQPTPDPARPNIILILTDDQPPQSIPYLPNIEKELVGKGITFVNGYVTTPLCCPSRASILTGLYAHNHGVLTDRPPQGGATVFKDAQTIAVWLKARGYRTALMGKYLNDYDALTPQGRVPPGWDEWDAFILHGKNEQGFYYGYTLSDNGKVVQYSMQPQDYSTDVLTAKALAFIKSSGNQPFFLMLDFYNPHQTYVSADRYKNMFKTDATFTPYRPPNFLPQDLTGKPQWLQHLAQPDAVDLDHIYQRILRSLMAVDDSVGQVAALLDQLGLRPRTAIFYLTDNGESLGDNGILGKNCPYDACIHVPYIVSYPPLTRQPRTDTHFVLNIDLAPTFAQLAGATVPTKVNGASIVPLLTNPAAAWRDSFLIEHFQELGSSDEGLTVAIPTYHGIRTEDWKYVEYDTGERELYDLKSDPYEIHNLAADAQSSAVIATLHSQLLALEKQ